MHLRKQSETSAAWRFLRVAPAAATGYCASALERMRQPVSPRIATLGLARGAPPRRPPPLLGARMRARMQAHLPCAPRWGDQRFKS